MLTPMLLLMLLTLMLVMPTLLPTLSCRADLLGLASPAESASRMRTSQRMMRSYAIFQQF